MYCRLQRVAKGQARAACATINIAPTMLVCSLPHEAKKATLGIFVPLMHNQRTREQRETQYL